MSQLREVLGRHFKRSESGVSVGINGKGYLALDRMPGGVALLWGWFPSHTRGAAWARKDGHQVRFVVDWDMTNDPR